MFIRKNRKKKQKFFSPIGIAHINTTSNNTIISISDLLGNIICWASCGTENLGFGSDKLKNTKKKTPYAAQMAAKCVAQKAISLGVESIGVSIKGTGEGREITIRAFKLAGLKIIYVEDRTPIAHNGCRPPKKRKL